MFSTDVVPVKSGYVSKNRNWVEGLHQYNAREGVIDLAAYSALKNFFMAMAGQYGSFRFKDWADFKSCAGDLSITDTDQVLGSGDGVTLDFQLIKTYVAGAMSTVRTIKKPVAGTVVLSVGGVTQTSRWSIDTTTGQVTFDADQAALITNATQDTECELSTNIGHLLSTGDSVYLNTFTGDWAALNGNRYVITKTQSNKYTIPVDTTLFAAYSANGGNQKTLPQLGESVAAGYEFDVPVRCDSDQMLSTWDNFQIQSFDLPLIEERL